MAVMPSHGARAAGTRSGPEVTAMTAIVRNTAVVRRTNAEWLAALRGGDGAQAALTDLRAYLLRAALFTLQRTRHHVGHLGSCR